MADERKPVLALFYCQQTPGCNEQDRQSLEEQFGGRIRFFPLPCGGRLEPIHLLKALEVFADAAYLIACPPNACRYFEGNLRAQRRIGKTQEALASIGLEKERVGIILRSNSDRPLADFAAEALDRAFGFGPSPVLKSPPHVDP